MSIFTSLLITALAAASPNQGETSQSNPTQSEPQQSTLERQLTGVFTNEEQAYFELDAGRTPPPWVSLRIQQSDGKTVLTKIDAFGTQLAKPQPISVKYGKERDIVTVGNCSRFFDREEESWTISAIQNKKLCRQEYQITRVDEDGLRLRFSDGSETILKRARPVECWAAAKKIEPKADGSPDWIFEQKLSLHDQGGRVIVGGGDSGAEPLILRMRSVYWPKPSTNRPSMVLYVHKPDNPDSAVSYSWADIEASRVGLNLRWMQASCTINGAERASEVSTDNFRG